jgi:hypothetical protein
MQRSVEKFGCGKDDIELSPLVSDVNVITP